MNIRTLATAWHALARSASLAALMMTAAFATGCYRDINRCDNEHPCKSKDAAAEGSSDGSAEVGIVDAPAGSDLVSPYVADAITADTSDAGSSLIIDASAPDAPEPAVTTSTKPVTTTSLTTETKPVTTTTVTTTTGSPLATNTQTANTTGPGSRTTTAVETYPIPSTNTVVTTRTVMTTALGTASASAITTTTAPDQVSTSTGTATAVLATSGMVTVTATSAVQGTQTVSTTAVLSATASAIGTGTGSDDMSNLIAHYRLEGNGPLFENSSRPDYPATAVSTGTDIGAIPGSTTSARGALRNDFGYNYDASFSVAFWLVLRNPDLISATAVLKAHTSAWDYIDVPELVIARSSTLTDQFDVTCRYLGTPITWTAALAAGQWFHLACTYERSNYMGTLYVDGREVAHGSFPHTIGQGAGEVFNSFSGGSTSVSSIDEIRVYQRQLTANEVQGIYNCNMTTCPDTKTVVSTSTGLSSATVTNLALATKTEYTLTSGATTMIITATQTSLATGLTATAASSVTATALTTGTATESTMGYVPTTATASRTTTAVR